VLDLIESEIEGHIDAKDLRYGSKAKEVI